MEKIINQEFGGERPLYFKKDLYLENVTIHAGESSLKETANIEAYKCTFEGKYPFWCCNKFIIRDCHFTEGARAALWYSKDLQMSDTLIEAPKMFREMDGMHLKNVRIPNAGETLWHCSHVVLDNVSADHGDYIFMHCSDIEVNDFKLNGNYSFQYSKNVVIRNSVLNTKDAFWMTENVTVYDSEINGEFLGWYSKNLHLINCKITGTQPLCYAEGLVMENCTMGADANLAFEYSTIEATINGPVTSVKNPRSGHITASSYGEIIIDENLQAPGDCKILTK
jgi:hypothetical protein